jgi:hypothetical protein
MYYSNEQRCLVQSTVCSFRGSVYTATLKSSGLATEGLSSYLDWDGFFKKVKYLF